MCFYLSFLHFIYFDKYHISLLADFIITIESRKVVLFFSGRALLSFLALKGFEFDNDFKRFNYLSAMKLFPSNINSF